MSGKRLLIATFLAALGVLLVFSVAIASPTLADKEQLGKNIFFDDKSILKP